MKIIMTVLLLIGAVLFSADGRAEIHRCTDADGNMVFSQFPCAEEPGAAKEKDEPEEVETAEADDTQLSSADIDAASRARDSEAIAQCQKPYKDAIDAIEARMVNGYTPDQAQAYKKQLLGLTRGLRRCES